MQVRSRLILVWAAVVLAPALLWSGLRYGDLPRTSSERPSNERLNSAQVNDSPDLSSVGQASPVLQIELVPKLLEFRQNVTNSTLDLNFETNGAFSNSLVPLCSGCGEEGQYSAFSGPFPVRTGAIGDTNTLFLDFSGNPPWPGVPSSQASFRIDPNTFQVSQVTDPHTFPACSQISCEGFACRFTTCALGVLGENDHFHLDFDIEVSCSAETSLPCLIDLGELCGAVQGLRSCGPSGLGECIVEGNGAQETAYDSDNDCDGIYGECAAPQNVWECDSGAGCGLDFAACDESGAGDCQHFTSVEVFDEYDNDCDGFADECDAPANAWSCTTESPTPGCEAGQAACNEFGASECIALAATLEIFDGEDNDCDGVDDNCALPQQSLPCSTNIQSPGCEVGQAACNEDGAGECLPPSSPEIYNGLDDDCNGAADDCGLPQTFWTCETGIADPACATTQVACDATGSEFPCVIHEVVNNDDDDCDSVIDECDQGEQFLPCTSTDPLCAGIPSYARCEAGVALQASCGCDNTCDGLDQDDDGLTDDDPGPEGCLLRFAFQPICFEGNDAAFEQAADDIAGFFKASLGLDPCSERIAVDLFPPSLFNPVDVCAQCVDSDFAGLDALIERQDFWPANSTEYTAIGFLTDHDICGVYEGFARLNLRSVWLQTDSAIVLSHEIGHLVGLDEEYCSQERGTGFESCNSPTSVNHLEAALGCDPVGNDCCSLDYRAQSTPDDPSPPAKRPILKNQNADYKREVGPDATTALAILNAGDVAKPEDLDLATSTCWVKMTEPSLEGLRQAFLDPVSRIRLASDPIPEAHAEFIAMAWQGGFLDGRAVCFNENLNVLIGGRGTGKSTVIESLRYVLGLDPLGHDAQTAHDGIVRHVLKAGTRISLLVRVHHPARREYVIERTVPNAPVVKDDAEQTLAYKPLDVVPRVQVFEQHEISELTKNGEKLTRLLDRFIASDDAAQVNKDDKKQGLAESRKKVADAAEELTKLDEKLAALPKLEETLKRFQEAGLEEKMKDKSLLIREEQLLKQADGLVGRVRQLAGSLRAGTPLDTAFLDMLSDELPSAEKLRGLKATFVTLQLAVEQAAASIEAAVGIVDTERTAFQTGWDAHKKTVEEAYEKTLRELQKAKIDGEEFVRLKKQIESLRPLRDQRTVLEKRLAEEREARRTKLVEWENAKAEQFRALEKAAKKVTKRLEGRVRVRVSFAAVRDQLITLLKDKVGGRLSEALETLRTLDQLSSSELATAGRSGKDVLVTKYSLLPAQAEKLAQAPESVWMEVEELDLPPTTTIELNTAPEGEDAVWQKLDDLSTGQKATAVLLLLLLDSDAPLVVDQPEDDLDNRFITESIVPKMREEKRRRQFVFATHNANIPVLGDAELIVGLAARSDGNGALTAKHMGAIDSRGVRELVEEVLEGGRRAFELRRQKYGF